MRIVENFGNIDRFIGCYLFVKLPESNVLSPSREPKLRRVVACVRSSLTFFLTPSIFTICHLQTLRQNLDSGKSLPFPDGVIINGQPHATFTGDQGNSFKHYFAITLCYKMSCHVM